MHSFIIYFLPSVLGLKIFCILNKDEKKFDLLINYLLFVLFSNFFCMVILNVMGRSVYDLFNTLETNFSFSFKYIFMTMLLNIILSILFTIINKYLKISIEVEKNEKRKKTKSTKSN